MKPTLNSLASTSRISRRGFVRSGVAMATMATTLGAPSILRAAERELNIVAWSDETPQPVLDAFEAKTGIRVNRTPISSNEEQLNKLRATGGTGFDLCFPTTGRAAQYMELGVLAPFDMSRIDTSVVAPSILKYSTDLWTTAGDLFQLPHCWGSDAVSWRTDKLDLAPEDVSYGMLWDESNKGHVQGRPAALLLAIGLWMDATGELPSNRMLDAFESEEKFKEIYNVLLKFAVDHKSWIRQFWGSADEIKTGLMQNDVWLGVTWDGPLMTMKNEGDPVMFQAPKEGAVAWCDGMSLLKEAKNVAEAYEFINFLYAPEQSAGIANGSGYNPVIQGAEAFLSEANKKNFAEAYPGDSIANLWWNPAEPAWFGPLRSAYADRFMAV